jgi:hypothetical protein
MPYNSRSFERAESKLILTRSAENCFNARQGQCLWRRELISALKQANNGHAISRLQRPAGGTATDFRALT